MRAALALLLLCPLGGPQSLQERLRSLEEATALLSAPAPPEPPRRVWHDGGWWARRGGRWVPEEPGWEFDQRTGRWFKAFQAPPVAPVFQPMVSGYCPGGT